ncbi:Outer membrane protein OmpA [Parafrankia irregularis]|uniref:Outer membrane protein OmpA n=1 Tax=Parafrankia irregularis TaxID=795642 RepID=A0A0S4QYJ2_9ACTN|nr:MULTISPECIES: OmpA family protein [Parafrankia]EFC84715.1 OmpA/MotB domain protein [Parafrankia sp. EUN1f]MBE3203418.1 OmpA family protein [Parafrankia sp. CH37]CUU60281.1 Outer membrane protein OmpA [Parafrankia irregularis]
MYLALRTAGRAASAGRRLPGLAVCAPFALAALLGLTAACSNDAAASTFTPAPHATRVPPTVSADPLPPLSSFITQADGSRVSTVSADYLFDADSDVLRPEAATALAGIVPQIREHDGKVQVVGYSDGLGSTEHNLELSRERAVAVQTYLTSQDIPAAMLEVVAKGEAGAADNVADASRRRVEIVLR